mmetsp:Transcript_13175/g.24316  ORF Transcript_13175/g.24316 Transcript_13175/m.24316 type:complete len:218 (-) Transcript_13175:1293-1946(-)
MLPRHRHFVHRTASQKKVPGLQRVLSCSGFPEDLRICMYSSTPDSRKPILSHDSPKAKIMSPCENDISVRASLLNLRSKLGPDRESILKKGCTCKVRRCNVVCTSSLKGCDNKLSSSTSERRCVSLLVPKAVVTYLITRSLRSVGTLFCWRKPLRIQICRLCADFMFTNRLIKEVVLDTNTEKTTRAKKSTMIANATSSVVLGEEDELPGVKFEMLQ